MSRENVELVRRAYEAWNRGDFDAAAEYLDPEIEWRTPPNIPEAGTWHGRDEVGERVAAFLESWEELHAGVEELIDAGDRVVALVRFSGRGRGTGLAVEGTSVDATVWTLREGKAVRIEMYGGTAEALEAVGLRE
jgi:uncharacterized protein